MRVVGREGEGVREAIDDKEEGVRGVEREGRGLEKP